MNSIKGYELPIEAWFLIKPKAVSKNRWWAQDDTAREAMCVCDKVIYAYATPALIHGHWQDIILAFTCPDYRGILVEYKKTKIKRKNQRGG